eukprot:4712550-Karenia_brevis.AAC.1
MDSKLLVGWLLGHIRVLEGSLRGLVATARDLLYHLKARQRCVVRWIPRGRNWLADRLAGKAAQGEHCNWQAF